MRHALALAALLAAASGAAASRTVTFPLVVDRPILEAALRRDLGMTDGGPVELWGSTADCHWAVADDVALAAERGRLRVGVKGATVVGFRLLWFCVSPIAWQGTIGIVGRPVVGPDWQLRFETTDVDARDLDGKPSPLGNAAVQVAKSQLEERLAAFRFDLGPPVDEAKQLVRAAAAPERVEAAVRAIDTLRPVETVVEPDGVRVRLAMDVPEAETPRAAPEGRLSDEQVKAWEERLDRWDAFLVFAVKTLGLTTDDRAVRSELLAILLDGRRELVDVLRQGPIPGTDPVRNLFLSSWDRLRVQTRRALREGTLGARAVRFVTFLAAGDALAALDQAGPGLGLEISADGLRRLARIVDPERTGDPVAISDAPDPELRTLFGFQDPGAEELAPAPASTSTAPPSTTSTPAPTEPPTTSPPSSSTTTTLPPTSWLFAPRAAEAAEPDLAAIAKRLDRWVPSDTELGPYRTVVQQLLDTVTAHRVGRVDDRLAPVYRHLVPSVAWQESCWRQFVLRNGSVTFLLSSTGDVGIMQVNRRVWRGFFDVHKLEWDAVYNAAAGAEILVELLGRFGAKEGATQADNAARATYSAYNGGPGAYARYRSAKASALGRAIDADFYDKYRRVATGGAGDLVLCM